ncbi:molybdopterin binding oxidoreductase [Basidiobolus meristosporus CBS 931.73]|uniref:Nitrate reductase [NADPH] n=1 Tax=Basidiobolus meristosporus CBS 931.73 TaxID=1314790 RepID=A0A1Y1XRD3_9FUNG|nr:molybdopterin binding oxidoreductase [Basidiobolus meristosporus CBS 931.73]|eukprot:ORX88329.1 molybdopterin binding oxidoreductase [Basidiobolus meristosporus CBS 931.73]
MGLTSSKAVPQFEADKELVYDERDKDTPDNWIPRHPSLIRTTGNYPFNAEPPLKRLQQDGYITSTALHYVRNHGYVPRLDWDTHTLEVFGSALRARNILNFPISLRLVGLSKTFTMEEIASFRKIEIPVTLSCSSNRLKQLISQNSQNTIWKKVASSTAMWGGVYLKDILKSCEIDIPTENESWFVHFEGCDQLPNGLYGTSIALSHCLDPDQEILLAYEINGERLTPDHGFPLRVIAPGYIGGRMVKWLKRIFISNKESDNWYHKHENRIALSIPEEIAQEDFPINQLSTIAMLCTPSHKEVIHMTRGACTLRGYAYAGDGRKVTAVEISFDQGQSWHSCNIYPQQCSPNTNKYWAWAFWSFTVLTSDLAHAEDIHIRVYPFESSLQFSRNDYQIANIAVEIDRHQDQLIRFLHPISQVDNSGWLEQATNLKKKRNMDPPDDHEGSPRLKKRCIIPRPKVFTAEDVARHFKPDDAWVSIYGRVYDCTDFMKIHPGGMETIAANAGTDCSREFGDIHSPGAIEMLEPYCVGRLADAIPHEPILEPFNPNELVALSPLKYNTFPLIEKITLNKDTRLFRLGLPSPKHRMGLPLGKHILLRAKINGRTTVRAYTPVSTEADLGHLDLAVKIYYKGMHPKYPNGGKFSQYLDSLEIGDTVEVKGPMGEFNYDGHGHYRVERKHLKGQAQNFAMIAGGTGLTPMLQLIRAILKDPSDNTKLSLLFANKSEEDILLREELERLTRKYPEQLKVWYTIDETYLSEWPYSTGFITYEMIRNHLPKPEESTVVLMSGPPPMLKFTCIPNLEKLGYDLEKCFTF